jgi:hypothetical protein
MTELDYHEECSHCRGHSPPPPPPPPRWPHRGTESFGISHYGVITGKRMDGSACKICYECMGARRPIRKNGRPTLEDDKYATEVDWRHVNCRSENDYTRCLLHEGTDYLGTP